MEAIEQLSIGGLNEALARGGAGDIIVYILSPLAGMEKWMAETSTRFGVTLAAVSGMDWDNDLTPWPAKGVPPGSPDFKGLGREFLAKLTDMILPSVEKHLGLQAAERTLCGISLSGLFALWQWSQTPLFKNILSLSGSFWYEGFVDWVARQNYSDKRGKAIFLLGDEEGRSRVFGSVEPNTRHIVEMLARQGVDTSFISVPGNHYRDTIPRLTTAIAALF